MKPLPFKMIQETKWEKWRAETFWTKEPETLKWIESFLPGSWFADIGANIGQYSLYAATLGHWIKSFEPQPANYQALLRNIGLNRFQDQIFAYPFALSDKQKISVIEIGSQDISGKSGIQIQKKGNYFVQCIPLVMYSDVFDYIKIDVDGNELEIARGLELTSMTLNSVLIEVSRDNQKEITEIFFNHGLEIDQRFEPYNIMTNQGLKEHSTNHRKASGSPVRNIVFTREKRT